MKATLYHVTISAEALSKDSVRGLMLEALEHIDLRESPDGTIIKDDGDTVDWSTKKREVACQAAAGQEGEV